MKKLAFIFPGQGSQYVGMGKELVDNFISAGKIFKTGSEIVGFDLLKAVSGDFGEEELKKTIIAQPCIFAVSLSAFFAARKTGVEPSAVAGHSLGEYAALVAAGVLTVEEGFEIIKLRSEIMQRSAETSPGGMAAVIGAKPALIESVCAEIKDGGDYVTPVNYNSPAQTVIAGSKTGLEKAIESLTNNNVRKIVTLPVGAAFHSDLMTVAAAEFKELIMGFSFKEPEKAFYSNLTGKLLTDFSDMPDYLARHMCSPVRFTDELTSMQTDGIGFFVEAGPGKTISALLKKNLENIRIGNIEDSKSLEGVNILWKS